MKNHLKAYLIIKMPVLLTIALSLYFLHLDLRYICFLPFLLLLLYEAVIAKFKPNIMELESEYLYTIKYGG